MDGWQGASRCGPQRGGICLEGRGPPPKGKKDLGQSKSAVTVLAPKGDGGLFRWVALLTGSKTRSKRRGFLFWGVLLFRDLGHGGGVPDDPIAVALFIAAGLCLASQGCEIPPQGLGRRCAHQQTVTGADVPCFGARGCLVRGLASRSYFPVAFCQMDARAHAPHFS